MKGVRWTRYGITLVAVALVAWLLGCVTNPITGARQLNFMGSGDMIAAAREAVPGQFASDYGVVSDSALNAYVAKVGKSLVATLTRADVVYPDMPFNFQVVNAVYVNAYAFPDGTIAITRGMLLELEDEAQLAAVLGHEIAHVNCGHTASAMSKGGVLGAVVAGTQGYLASSGSSWANMAGMAGQLGTAAYLATYSRSQEREADQGGMLYMTRAGYDPQGMVELMELLVKLGGSSPSALEQLFSSHPMSSERLQSARERVAGEYRGVNAGVRKRAEFQAATSRLRSEGQAVKLFAAAEGQLAQGQHSAARSSVEQGLRQIPNDYAGLMILAQARQKLGDAAGARQAAEQASRMHRSNARALGMLAQDALARNDFSKAMQHLNSYERQVPNDATTAYYKGVTFEAQGQSEQATRAYRSSAQRGGAGSAVAQHSQSRLKEIERKEIERKEAERKPAVQRRVNQKQSERKLPTRRVIKR